MITDAAVFINKRRRYKGVNVIVSDDTVIVTNKVNGAEIQRFDIVETAADGMAWDAVIDGKLSRLVAQQGCGCGGEKPYKTKPDYSGAL
jgi:hypothetical protein